MKKLPQVCPAPRCGACLCKECRDILSERPMEAKRMKEGKCPFCGMVLA